MAHPFRAPLAVLALLLSAAAASAQPDPDLAGARAAVLAQLDAFRSDDFDAAYRFASAAIHAQFDRARFEAMVRGGYPEIARSVSAVVDGAERAPGGHLYLFVRIRGANGRTVQAVYEMVAEDGGWKVDAVVTRPDTSETASRPPAGGGPGQNRPTMLPSASTSIDSAPGFFGSPGIVRMSPA